MLFTVNLEYGYYWHFLVLKNIHFVLFICIGYQISPTFFNAILIHVIYGR
jgi:hypothetical protein